MTDHANLVCKSLTSDRVMRWRLYIEEYSPELTYLKGVDNQAADALSRLPKLEEEGSESQPTVDALTSDKGLDALIMGHQRVNPKRPLDKEDPCSED